MAWLAEEKTASLVDPLFEDLLTWDTETACTRLGQWAGEPESGEVVGEGLLLGRVSRVELYDQELLRRIARRLASAYVNQLEDFRAPYFDLAS
jgi:hypothetical protein